jgi:hypothetical protein
VKAYPVQELSEDGISKAVATAESEPVLVTKDDEPFVWMISAREVTRASAQLGNDRSVYASTLAVIAVDLYRCGDLSIGKAARLAGSPLAEFIQLCGKMDVPVLDEPPGGLDAELRGLEAALESNRRGTEQ